MTIACKLCGAMISGRLIADNDPQLIGVDRMAADYQAAIIELVNHAGQQHPETLAVFHGISQTYLIHLVANLAISSDPKFEETREAARKLVYWTLATDVRLELRPSVLA